MKTKIIYEDQDILVCQKPAGIAVETRKTTEMDMVSELKNYLKKSTGSKEVPYLGVIHRLDQPVSGILVFARNRKSAAHLSELMKQGKIKKIYLAAVYGTMKERKGELVDYLYQDEMENRSFVVDSKFCDAKGNCPKYSKLTYEVCADREQDGIVSQIVRIELETGRHHQIRVQFSHAGNPLLGDLKYGTKESIEASEELFLDSVSLCAYALRFVHPTTLEEMEFTLPKKPINLR